MPGLKPPAPTESTPLQQQKDDQVDDRPADDSKTELIQRPAFIKNPISWYRHMQGRWSPDLLWSIFVSYHVLKGFVAGGGDEGLVGKPAEFLLAAQHVPAGRMQALMAVGGFAPWVLKPLVGILSDTVPFFGYRRNSYVVILTMLSVIAVANLASGMFVSPGAIVACVFFVSLQVAGTTLMVDAKQSEVVKTRSEFGPELISYRETCMNSGMILSALVVGPMIMHWGTRSPYFLALPLVGVILLMAGANWLGDKRLKGEENQVNFEVIRQNPQLFALGFMLLPLLLILACGSLLKIPEMGMLSITLVASLLVVVGYSAFIRPEMSRPVMFFFIARCLNLQISGALFYFFTDSVEAFPLGPHFSPTFYVSCLTSVAIVGRMIGFITAKDLFGHWHYQKSLTLTIPMCCITQLALVPLLLRWNVAMGIPDGVWVLAWTFCDMVVRGWRMFPFSVMLLQATPKGLEASALALNAGCANMGITLSSFFGSFALNYWGIKPSGHSTDALALSGIWKAQMAAALLPILALPLMPLMMPKGRQVEALIVDNPKSATHGAPAEKYGCCV